MFQTIQLPAGIAHLDTSLSNMYTDAFPLKNRKRFSNLSKLKSKSKEQATLVQTETSIFAH
jgi:hypothetical protein